MITINISNRVLYTLLVVILLLIAGVSAVAYQSGLAPSVAGHSADEIEVVFNDSQSGRLLSDVMNEYKARIGIHDPLKIELFNSDTTTWVCEQQDLKDYCGDADGCEIRVLMQAQVDDDPVKTMNGHMYLEQLEQPGLSKNNAPGIYGFFREEAGESAWNLGRSGKSVTIAGPWNWAWIRNFIQGECPGQNGVQSAPFVSDPYVLSFSTIPTVETTFLIYD
jgi:hypothetical protein